MRNQILNAFIQGVESTILALMIVGIVGLVAMRIWGGQILSVQTASMVPTIRSKDAVIVKPVPVGELKVGDIISYRSPNQPRVVITHRLVAIDHAGDRLTTAGDSSGIKDPTFSSQLVAGKAIALAPKFGLVIDILHNPYGLVAAIYLPALLVIVVEARQLVRVYARPIYSVRL
jgi:signal peptidase I